MIPPKSSDMVLKLCLHCADRFSLTFLIPIIALLLKSKLVRKEVSLPVTKNDSEISYSYVHAQVVSK